MFTSISYFLSFLFYSPIKSNRSATKETNTNAPRLIKRMNPLNVEGKGELKETEEKKNTTKLKINKNQNDRVGNWQ